LPTTENNFRGSFWWRDILKLLDKYKSIASVTVEDGNSCLFWLDTWNDTPLCHQFPELYSFAKNTKVSIALAASTQDFHSLFHLPPPLKLFNF